MWDTTELAGHPSQALEVVPSCPLSTTPSKKPTTGENLRAADRDGDLNSTSVMADD